MNILSRLRIRTKMAMVLTISTIAMIAIAVTGASTLYQRMLDDRIDELRAEVSATVALATALEARVVAKEITRDEALAAFRRDVYAIRYDNGVGYMGALDATSGNVLAMGLDPRLEGKPTPPDAATGRPISSLILDLIRSSDDGVASYMFAKPGHTEPVRKFVASTRFPAWNMVVNTGAYTDDLDAPFNESLLWMGAFGGGIVLLTLLAGGLVTRDVTGSLGGLRNAMDRLARGDLATPVPGTGRQDEVGAMAATVLVFKDNMTETERLRTAREEARLRAASGQKAALLRMADGFEGNVGKLVGMLSSRSAELESTARSMSGTADRSNQQAATVASAAEEATTGLQTVAAAAEELTASIGEIGRQVAQSSKITGRAVDDAKRTDGIVHALADGAEKIGAVVDLITNIASQTNLLALNADLSPQMRVGQ